MKKCFLLLIFVLFVGCGDNPDSNLDTGQANNHYFPFEYDCYISEKIEIDKFADTSFSRITNYYRNEKGYLLSVELGGNIKIENVTHDENGNITSYSLDKEIGDFTYHEDRYIIDVGEAGLSKNKLKYIYYLNNFNLYSREEFYINDELFSNSEYEYDSNNNLIKKTNFVNEKITSVKEWGDYDNSSGLLMLVFKSGMPSNEPILHNPSWIKLVDYENSEPDDEIIYNYSYEYNEKGYVSERTIINEEGEEISTESYTYECYNK
jgi:hypothetical protein